MNQRMIAGWVLLGSLFPVGICSAQSLLHEFSGALELDLFGVAVDGAGDVNGNGTPDLVIGAWGYNALGARAEVYDGGSGNLLHTFFVADFMDASGAGDVDNI